MAQNPNMMPQMGQMGHIPMTHSAPNMQQMQPQQMPQSQMPPMQQSQMQAQMQQMQQSQIQAQMMQQMQQPQMPAQMLQQMQQMQQQGMQRQMGQIPNSASTPQIPNVYQMRSQQMPNMYQMRSQQQQPAVPPQQQYYAQQMQQPPPQPEKPQKVQKREEINFIPFPTNKWLEEQRELDMRTIIKLMKAANKTGEEINFDEDCTRALVQGLKIYMQNFLRLLVVYSKRRKNDPIYGEKNYSSVPRSRFAMLAAEREIILNKIPIKDTDQQLPCDRNELISAIAFRKPAAEREDFINKFHTQDNDNKMELDKQIEMLPQVQPKFAISPEDVLFVLEQLKSTKYQTLTDLRYEVELMKK